jgi:hypothetical protein
MVRVKMRVNPGAVGIVPPGAGHADGRSRPGGPRGAAGAYGKGLTEKPPGNHSPGGGKPAQGGTVVKKEKKRGSGEKQT